jgi:O-antigen/teichoic acid export membrane protein
VLGQVAAAGSLALLSLLATRSLLSLTHSREHARSLFSFSSQVSLQQLLHAINGIVPSFAVSRSLGQTSLGFYSRGSLLVFLPQTFLSQGIYKTLYPIYPRFRNDHEERRRMMIDVACVATMVWPLFGALAGLAPLAVEVMLGSQWTPVAAIIGPLCLYAAADFAYAIFTSFTESAGQLRLIWVIQTCWTIVLVAALGIAVVANAEMRTLVLVAAGVQVWLHILQVALLARADLISAKGIVLAEIWAAAVTLAWFAATTLTSHVVAAHGLAVRLAASSVVVVLLGVATWLVLPYLPAGQALTRRGFRAWRPAWSPLS